MFVPLTVRHVLHVVRVEMCVSKVPDVAVEFIFGVMPLAVQGYDVKQMREANGKIVLV